MLPRKENKRKEKVEQALFQEFPVGPTRRSGSTILRFLTIAPVSIETEEPQSVDLPRRRIIHDKRLRGEHIAEHQLF